MRSTCDAREPPPPYFFLLLPPFLPRHHTTSSHTDVANLEAGIAAMATEGRSN